jgi:hypothetical protein
VRRESSMPYFDALTGVAKLLVISGERLGLMIIEFSGNDQHDIRVILAVTAPPHLQLESDVLRVLPSEIWNRR